MSKRSRDKVESAKRSRLDRQNLPKRHAKLTKKRTLDNDVKPTRKRILDKAAAGKERKTPMSKARKKALAIASSVCISSALVVGSTTAQAAGFIDSLKFLAQAKSAVDNFFAAGSIVALGTGMSNALIIQNNSKSAERLDGAIQSITQVTNMRDVMTSMSANNIPDSLKCTALYNNKYSLFQNLISKEYTFQQMSLAAANYSKNETVAKKENMERNLTDYCSVDETAMGYCTFTPDGTGALSQDYSHISVSKKMDPIAQTAATDLANNMVIIAQSEYAQNCTSVDCERIRSVERQYTAIASLVHGSILGQINASTPLAYEPLRDYVNENMGIGSGSSAPITPDPADATTVTAENGGALTEAQIKESASDVGGAGEVKKEGATTPSKPATTP
ncbi:MAG: hypothetical protein VYA60_07645 [Pseudomonadota bacterium]|nr:hypothetical protein [Pseudomonadota bacterium]